MKRHSGWGKYICMVLLLQGLTSFQSLSAQAKTVSDYISVNGYIKDLATVAFAGDVNSLTPYNLLHNRINLKIKPVNHLTIAVEERTRLLLSNEQVLIPGFGQTYTHDNGLVNMSFNWVNKSPVLFNTFIDRLYIDWTDSKWDIRVGRQRLNWGINTTWNPNDIFNTYNFLDFDYEERPGSDAVKVQYNFTSFSNLEAAFSPSRNVDSMIGALKYAFNTHNYDIQFIGGNYCRDVVVGLGWAGNIKDAGFKGEVSYFQNWHDTRFQHVALSASGTVDYSFKNGLYMSLAFLYNNLATNSLYSAAQLQSENLSPKLLMPAKYNLIVTASKQFSPVLNGSLALIYSPQINLFVIAPTLSYSLATNWDADLIIQSYFANNINNKFDVLGNSLNFRVRWSFSN